MTQRRDLSHTFTTTGVSLQENLNCRNELKFKDHLGNHWGWGGWGGDRPSEGMVTVVFNCIFLFFIFFPAINLHTHACFLSLIN